MTETKSFPIMRTVGVDGLLVTFSDAMTEPSNRAALAFCGAVEALNLEGICETSASLASTYIRFDANHRSHSDISNEIRSLLAQRDWFSSPLPAGRKFWKVPTVYGTDLAPQMDEAAAVAGLSTADAIDRLSQARVRVLTIGFAPGQPYLGPLGPEFNIPRQTALTPMVPEGALVLAISQFVLFSGPTPTGWRHVGQTAFRCFRPEVEDGFSLRPGDEMQFFSVSRDEWEELRDRSRDGFGGATCQEIPA